MAKIRKNIIIEGLSGSLGEQLVIRHDKAGRTIVAISPKFDPDRTFSEAQVTHQEKFREAAAYAKDAKEEALYVSKAEGTPKSAYNVAVADWFHAPEVKEIDMQNWHGGVNELIRIKAVDNVNVTQVNVVITDDSGTVLEQGTASRGDAHWWEYSTQTAISGSPKVVVMARDLPGNIGQLIWEE